MVADFVRFERALRRRMAHLYRWYGHQARDLPWRRTRDPYAIWVAEAMLQQTQVVTVVPYYQRWLAAFPTVRDLARAPERRVLLLWEGLGYYARARHLRQAAREVVRRFRGRIPDHPALFSSLPGVGPYTTAAVMSIAFGHPLAVLDGNVRRVLCRVMALKAVPTASAVARQLETLAARLISGHDPSQHNQAMMELGALICTARSPQCPRCPLRAVCLAITEGTPEHYPWRRSRPAVPQRTYAVGIIEQRGRLLLRQRPAGGLLAGLWDLPAVELAPDDDGASSLRRHLAAIYGIDVAVACALPRVQHAYTHLHVTLHPFLCTVRAATRKQGGHENGRGQVWGWFSPQQRAMRALSRASHKVLALKDRCP